MPVRLNAADADFEDRFRALLGAKREVSEDVDAIVRGIVARVRTEGDAALVELTRRYDGLDALIDAARADLVFPVSSPAAR